MTTVAKRVNKLVKTYGNKVIPYILYGNPNYEITVGDFKSIADIMGTVNCLMDGLLSKDDRLTADINNATAIRYSTSRETLKRLRQDARDDLKVYGRFQEIVIAKMVELDKEL